jgi:DNA repair protein RadC
VTLCIREVGEGEATTAPVLTCPKCQTPIALGTVGASWTIHGPKDIAERLIPTMGALEREELHVLLLNTRNVVLADVRVYQGNVSSSLVRVGELFTEAVRRNAAAIVIAHNHPSGDPTPSADDLRLTAEALAAGRLLDIQLLDHVVIAGDRWTSLRDRGVAFDR